MKIGGKDLSPEDKAELDLLLEEVDDRRIADGEPPLSMMVAHNDGAPSTAFLRTAAKHNLRLEGETDGQLVARYVKIAQEHELAKLTGKVGK